MSSTIPVTPVVIYNEPTTAVVPDGARAYFNNRPHLGVPTFTGYVQDPSLLASNSIFTAQENAPYNPGSTAINLFGSFGGN